MLKVTAILPLFLPLAPLPLGAWVTDSEQVAETSFWREDRGIGFTKGCR